LIPGENGWLQLDLMNEIVAAKSDHFILRRPSPSDTIGGGVILDPHPEKYHKRFSQSVYEHFEMLETGSLKDQILALITARQPIQLKELIKISAMDEQKVINELQPLIDNEVVVLESLSGELSPNGSLVTRSEWELRSQQIFSILRNYHAQYPLRAGISKNELKEKIALDTDRLNKFIEGLTTRNLIGQSLGLISLPDHQVKMSDKVMQDISRVENAFNSDPFSPPPLSELKQSYGLDLINLMIANRYLVVTSEDIAFRKKDFDAMAQGLIELGQKADGFSLGEFRDKYKTSRKFALSFLEYLDKIGATRFNGEKRVIRDIDKLNL
jgi:selenocysteine-specific elongation factor